MNKIKVGLIGIGNMGSHHLRVLSMLNSVSLSFVYDTDLDKAACYAIQYGVEVASEGLDDVLKEVDAVIISSPTSTHYDYIAQCANYVKNIFVEKPIADTLKSAQKIYDLSIKKKLNIQIGFIERFNPAVVSVKNLLASNGDKILNMDFIRTNKVSSRITDVDVIIDLMIHDIDLALYFNGEIADIYAYGIFYNNLISYARATLNHRNGTYSHITASRITEKRIRSISVMTDKSYIDCNLLSKEVFINKQTMEQQPYENISIISRQETIAVKPQEALLNELLAFIEYCQTGEKKKYIPDACVGLKTVEVAQAIQKIINGSYESHN